LLASNAHHSAVFADIVIVHGKGGCEKRDNQENFTWHLLAAEPEDINLNSCPKAQTAQLAHHDQPSMIRHPN